MLKNIAPKGRSRAVKGARRLRRDMTLPEVILWQALRKQANGLKFRRQHPSGVYILDFFCSDARLAIEVDGEAHNRGDRPARDEARDAWLRAAGVETLRIPASDVLKLMPVFDGSWLRRWLACPSTIRRCRMVPLPETSSGRIYKFRRRRRRCSA